MCKLLTRSSRLRKILRCLQKRKGNTWGETWGMSFLEARKIVGSYMEENSYSSVAQRVNTTNEDNKYRALVEKSIQLETNDWSKFQEQLKKLYSTEFYQAPAQQWVRNEEKSNVIVQTKTRVGSTTPTQTTSKSARSPTKQLLYKSPIHPLKCIKDRLRKLSPIKPEQLKPKSQAPISQSGKIQMNTKVNNEKQGSAFKMPSRTVAYKNQTVQCSWIDKTLMKNL